MAPVSAFHLVRNQLRWHPTHRSRNLLQRLIQHLPSLRRGLLDLLHVFGLLLQRLLQPGQFLFQAFDDFETRCNLSLLGRLVLLVFGQVASLRGDDGLEALRTVSDATQPFFLKVASEEGLQ